jgi:hypothetical protein
MISTFSGSITPKQWVTVGHHMIRLRTWELTYDQVCEAVKPFIVDGNFKLVVRTEKNGCPIGYSALLVEKESDMDRIRSNSLIYTPLDVEGEKPTVIAKIQKYSKSPGYDEYTIKTTAPLWASRQMIKDIFSKYSSDKDYYTLTIDGRVYENEQYPIIRFSRNTVMRYGIKTDVNVVYIEYSPKHGCEDDALVAQSMQYRTYVKNPNDLSDIASLVFKFWKLEKIERSLFIESDKPKSLEEKEIVEPGLFIIPKRK